MVEFIAPILTGDVAGDGHGRHRADYFKFTVPVETEEEARQALKASYEKSELKFGAIGDWEAENGEGWLNMSHVNSEKGKRAMEAIMERFFPGEEDELEELYGCMDWLGEVVGNKFSGLALFYMLHNAPEGTTYEDVEFVPIFGEGGTIPIYAGYWEFSW